MAVSVLEIHREFDHINRETDDIYFQYNTCVSIMYFFIFFVFSFAEVIKTCYTIILRIMMNAEENICF